LRLISVALMLNGEWLYSADQDVGVIKERRNKIGSKQKIPKYEIEKSCFPGILSLVVFVIFLWLNYRGGTDEALFACQSLLSVCNKVW